MTETEQLVEVAYKGPTRRDDISNRFSIREVGEDGKPGRRFVLRKGEGVYTPVPSALAKELLEGSTRTKGHKFTAKTDDDAAAAKAAKTKADDEAKAAKSGQATTTTTAGS